MQKIKIDSSISIISADRNIYKTEGFVKKTTRILGIDVLIEKLAEAVFLEENATFSEGFLSAKNIENDIEVKFTFGENINYNKNLKAKDIVFFHYSDNYKDSRESSKNIAELLNKNHCEFVITSVKADKSQDFFKIYRLSNYEQVNFPLLNESQKKLVEIEDENVLVQGVAGSGKTNICIDKIVFCACREYAGKVLYTTFSRGLVNETKSKVEIFKLNLMSFLRQLKEDKVLFLEKDHKRAVENHLGLYFDVNGDDQIVKKIERIIAYLDNKVDYLLIEDIYRNKNGVGECVGERFFINNYLTQIKNHQLSSKIERINYLSYEVIYKEIYGMIFGSEVDNLSLDDYVLKRKDSFNKIECETIFSIAQDFYKFLQSNGLVDNNIMSKSLINNVGLEYSLSIIDEVQDFTENNLQLLKKMSRKLFCVGDASQMINPTYFSFSYLKRLLYEKDIINVSQLENNYRNSKKIADIVDSLSKINVEKFGTHNFLLKVKSIDTVTNATTIFVEDSRFVDRLQKLNFDSYTIVVNSVFIKNELRKRLPNAEILTVSEIKGLERETIILYNILTDNLEKWKALERIIVNRKKADENSVYRYYYNLFYVGLSRAKNNLFVFEEEVSSIFKGFFDENFEKLSADDSMVVLNKILAETEVGQEELVERIDQFIKLEQFDNARFCIDKLQSVEQRSLQMKILEVNKEFIRFGKNREAGIRFWEFGMIKEAKERFLLSKDNILIELIDACTQDEIGALGIDIINFYPLVKDNEVARELIIKILKEDCQTMKEKLSSLSKDFKGIKEKNNE